MTGRTAAAPATVTGEGVRWPLTVTAGWEGRATDRETPDIRKPGDLPARRMNPGGVTRCRTGGSRPFFRSVPTPLSRGRSVMTWPSSCVELLVCTRCRRGQELPKNAERSGESLFRSLAESGIAGVRITPVECLSNCSRGCTVALRGPGRWTYVYGGLAARDHLAVIREGTKKYAATSNGLVPWRERPEHFRKNCIARIPPLDVPLKQPGERSNG